jgi:hypothetical protein
MSCLKKDGIFPALLQEGQRTVVPYLVRTFHASLATGFVPAIWRQVEAVFIPKPGTSSYSGPTDFSLTSFLLKTMKRLVDRFLRDKAPTLCHCIPTSMLTRLGNPWKRPFISLTSRKQLWVFF